MSYVGNIEGAEGSYTELVAATDTSIVAIIAHLILTDPIYAAMPSACM